MVKLQYRVGLYLSNFQFFYKILIFFPCVKLVYNNLAHFRKDWWTQAYFVSWIDKIFGIAQCNFRITFSDYKIFSSKLWCTSYLQKWSYKRTKIEKKHVYWSLKHFWARLLKFLWKPNDQFLQVIPIPIKSAHHNTQLDLCGFDFV